MGGSGGGGYFSESPPQRVGEALRREEEATENQIFDTNVAREIGDVLSDYNDRDSDAVRRAIGKARKALESEIEDASITPVFGGSVRKHTYVSGISDIDSLFVLRGEGIAERSPAEVLDQFEGALTARFPEAEVTRDNIAVGIELEGIKLELLPAIRKEGATHISSPSQDKWSKIKPESFFAKLSEVNDQNGAKVVPTIKIAKGIIDTFSDDCKLTGYHVESLAIEAFKNYVGPQNTKAMVERFFDFARERVLSPIKDRTGQSVHVDGYAGRMNSTCRRLMAQNLDRISRRIKNANATQSIEKWQRILNQEPD
jgi:tRNA nucleotidyltransferase (CCA-adding enzyme)